VTSNSARNVGGTLLRTPVPSYRIEDCFPDAAPPFNGE
jgi:hypothetical protein